MQRVDGDTVTLQALSEDELEKSLRDLGFIEVSVEDTLWLNLRRQEGEEARA